MADEVNYSNFVNEDGSFNENWINLVPEEIRGENSLKAIPDFGTMAKNYVNAQKMVGADKIVLPGKNAKPEDWDSVYNKLGRPEKPDGYLIQPPSDIPKEFPLDNEMIGEFKTVAHKIGLNNSQVKGLFEWFMAKEISNYNTYSEMLNKEEEELSKSISENPYEREKLKKSSDDILKAFGNEMIQKLADQTGLSKNPAFILLMNEFAAKISEETMKNIKPQGAGIEGSKAAIQEKINSIIQNLESPYYDRKNPKHKETVAEVERLYNQYQGLGA